MGARRFRDGCRANRDVVFHWPQWRESNPAFVRANERTDGAVNAIDRRFTGSTAVAARRIELLQTRVWAASVPSTSCGRKRRGIRGGNCTRVAGSRNRCTSCCTTRTDARKAAESNRIPCGTIRLAPGARATASSPSTTRKRRTRIGVEDGAATPFPARKNQSFLPGVAAEQWTRNELWPKRCSRLLGREPAASLAPSPEFATLGPL